MTETKAMTKAEARAKARAGAETKATKFFACVRTRVSRNLGCGLCPRCVKKMLPNKQPTWKL